LLFGADSYFDTDESIKVEFSVNVSHVGKRSVGVPKDCIDFANVNTRFSIDDNRFKGR